MLNPSYKWQPCSPKKANNLEIIQRSLRLEIERCAPVSNLFGSTYFINSAEYLRTRSEEGKKSSKALCKVGEFLNWGLYSVNGTYKYHSDETSRVVQSYECCHLSFFLEELFAACYIRAAAV